MIDYQECMKKKKKKNSLVPGNAADEKNVHLGRLKLIF